MSEDSESENELPLNLDPDERKIAWLFDALPRQEGEDWDDYLKGVHAAHHLLTKRRLLAKPDLKVVK